MSGIFHAFLENRCPATLAIAPGITTPRRFSDSTREHLAARRTAGLFDFSFMCCVEITGRDCLAFLNSLQTRKLDRLPVQRLAYTLLLRDDGSVLNDATVWRIAEHQYRMYTGRREDFEHIARDAGNFEVAVHDTSRETAIMAVQGSAAWTVIGRCFKRQLLPGLPYYGIGQFDFSGAPCWIARLGYSGESGGELVVADAAAPALWQALLAAGADAGMIECGFDAADALRIEAGHILFARELASRVFPGELGFTRFVDFDRAPFHGMRALQSRRRQPPWRRLTGLLPRHESWPSGQALPDRIVCGNAVLTSACWSPIYARQIGIGFVNADDACPGTTVKLTSGVTARTARLPFYDPAKRLARNAR